MPSSACPKMLCHLRWVGLQPNPFQKRLRDAEDNLVSKCSYGRNRFRGKLKSMLFAQQAVAHRRRFLVGRIFANRVIYLFQGSVPLPVLVKRFGQH